jgi:hypothetical protein
MTSRYLWTAVKYLKLERNEEGNCNTFIQDTKTKEGEWTNAKHITEARKKDSGFFFKEIVTISFFVSPNFYLPFFVGGKGGVGEQMHNI